jgi:hypothetical protein
MANYCITKTKLNNVKKVFETVTKNEKELLLMTRKY